MKRIAIPILILILASTTALAAPPRGPQDGGPAGAALLPPRAIADFLDLSEAQIAQVAALRATMRATIAPLREQQRTHREQIETALAAGNAQAAGTAMLASYNLRQQVRAAHETFRTSFETLLTAEQKSKWAVYEEIAALRRAERPQRPDRSERRH